ncbi:MAG: EamA family transporter RarD [Pirellulales bacterium]|jgi:chloramphenicol-sensitive protein RarD|nr:EamA family transporter RarD [Thermoguttaceae bacterium]MDD4786435.1 EamA family transporter RarD [Pirellulales bacterium]MDI9445500.1 EamA family transporter RarD [Planctomycetota bacterium]NLZ02490.1 EamA family transporter RarD [Pirellulaceae bacterium]
MTAGEGGEAGAGRSQAGRSLQGLACGLAAYGLWGLIPLYFRAVRHVPPLEMLAHRAAWSLALLAVVAGISGQWRKVRDGLRGPKAVLMLGLSTAMLSVNWLTFIYAVATAQVLQASLGYFITPLVNVLLGVLVLGERLRLNQKISIGLAAAGVGVLALAAGVLPWIALVLAASFSLYGLLRKTMPTSGLVGVLIETLAMTPPAILYLAYAEHAAVATEKDAGTWCLLALSGVVTSVPLLLFVGAARRLQLSTLGILQYLAPTMHFLVAVFVFHEPFSGAQLSSFFCIWAAVGLYAADSLAASRTGWIDLLEPD